MKSFLKVILVLILGFQAGVASAQSQPPIPVIKPPSIFDEGTQAGPLSPDQVKNFAEYATNARAQMAELSRVTADISKESVDRLVKGFEKIIAASSPKQNETLIRFVLNRALKITQAIEKESDPSDLGVIDQEWRILRRSIEFASKKADLDKLYLANAEQKGNPPVLPFSEFGVEYADWLIRLSRSIVDSSAKYTVVRLALGLLQWDLYRNPSERNENASSIKAIYDVIDELPETASQSTDLQLNHLVLRMIATYDAAKQVLPKRLESLLGHNSVVQSQRPAESVRADLSIDADYQQRDFRFTAIVGEENSNGLEIGFENVPHASVPGLRAYVAISYGGFGPFGRDLLNTKQVKLFQITASGTAAVDSSAGFFETVDVRVRAVTRDNINHGLYTDYTKSLIIGSGEYIKDQGIDLDQFTTVKLVGFESSAFSPEKTNWILNVAGNALGASIVKLREHGEMKGLDAFDANIKVGGSIHFNKNTFYLIGKSKINVGMAPKSTPSIFEVGTSLGWIYNNRLEAQLQGYRRGVYFVEEQSAESDANTRHVDRLRFVIRTYF